jgi:hydantoinase/carbamoylase family amidase
VSSLAAELEAAAQIGADGGGVSRFAWTPELSQANDWLMQRLREIGLEAEVDAAGNVFGRWNAGEGPAVLVGSHLDTVPRGGRYDGTLGVLAALATARALRADGVAPTRPLWVVSFNDEEGSRFQTGMLGSRAFCGELDLEDWRRRGVADAMAHAGFEFERLAEARGVEGVGAYLELHVEQGPVLERAGAPLGIVTSIAGQARGVVVVDGEARHAGTTPMDTRSDALTAAAELVLRVRDAASGIPGAVATVGRLEVEPGASNVVPGRVTLSVDARAPDQERLDALLGRLGLELAATAPSAMDRGLMGVLREEIERRGLEVVELSSGAGHDAGVLAAAGVPAAMLFVRSAGGISHHPDEETSPADVAVAVDVLAAAAARLAG